MTTVTALSLRSAEHLSHWSSIGHDGAQKNVPYGYRSGPSTIILNLSIGHQLARPRSSRLLNQVRACCIRPRTISDPTKYP
jgi:hypothetical protein